MTQGTLQINNTYQTFYVQVEDCKGEGGHLAPIITVPLKFDLNPQIDRPFQVLFAKGELFAFDRKIRIGEATHLLSQFVRDKSNMFIYFKFGLSAETLSRIESYRKKSLNFTLDCHLQSANCELIQNKWLQSTAITSYGAVTFQLEQSNWVENILPALGYNKTKLIEVPIYNNVIPEDFSLALSEFDQATNYFNNGDYDKCVSHCRAALDPFCNDGKLQKLITFIKDKSEVEWAVGIAEATEVWLTKLIKSTARLTHKTHHAPSTGHFSRTESEIVLMITTGIVAFIGKIEYKEP